MRFLNSVALTLIIIGAINWGLIAFFQFDLVAALFGGQDGFLARVVYGLVGISGLYYLTRAIYPIGDNPANRPDLNTGKLNYGTEFGEEETDIDNPSAHSLQTSEQFKRPTGHHYKED
ncbi:DUF378 domain-containing protein [Oceanobacillus senegalensis]|uniref:DUF378 domain-containing protein n=1 Tax=Oceanobacillus senegalensis TaxID=1936063 RepID=UPI000A308580|nr:DUF378 domain-containing protein [Oceanobacillus senegalensis]